MACQMIGGMVVHNELLELMEAPSKKAKQNIKQASGLLIKTFSTEELTPVYMTLVMIQDRTPTQTLQLIGWLSHAVVLGFLDSPMHRKRVAALIDELVLAVGDVNSLLVFLEERSLESASFFRDQIQEMRFAPYAGTEN